MYCRQWLHTHTHTHARNHKDTRLNDTTRRLYFTLINLSSGDWLWSGDAFVTRLPRCSLSLQKKQRTIFFCLASFPCLVALSDEGFLCVCVFLYAVVSSGSVIARGVCHTRRNSIIYRIVVATSFGVLSSSFAGYLPSHSARANLILMAFCVVVVSPKRISR